jgi:molecular chaperone GrpE
MDKTTNKREISDNELNQTINQISALLKSERLLKQIVENEKDKNQSFQEELFLELLEIFDSLESLLSYLEENPEPSSRFIKRLPKSIGAVQKKLLTILERKNVNLIELQDLKPDFKVCQVVDQEIRNDVEEHTITKIVRQGFKIGENTLRPVEIITAKKE